MATRKTSRKKSNRLPAGARSQVVLDPAFYPVRLVKQAAGDFAHLAQIKASLRGDRLVVDFSGMSRAQAARLPDEFVNYLLSLAVCAS